MAIRTPKAPLCKGGCQKSLISDWGIVKSRNMTTPPSKIGDFAHLPLHRGRLFPLRGRTVESMNFGMIATGNHCDFNALRAAPQSLHWVYEAFKLPCHCEEGEARRGNLLVQSTEMHSRNRHGTGRFPRA